MVPSARTPADLSAYEVVREQCVSKDGTKVPLNIVRRKGLVLDGRNPVLLTGYGGFGIPSAPGFSRSLPVWLEAGGVYAVANIRGGGEFGERWHQQGMLHNKQNGFGDFIACQLSAGYGIKPLDAKRNIAIGNYDHLSSFTM